MWILTKKKLFTLSDGSMDFTGKDCAIEHLHRQFYQM